ncbi:radical SAM protein [Candidatus Borrarchaeum sp.]|uniref:B12-binding domain-containing radical SAM protein n=1 Tax=Candidatus Borrarchaeum sp. TaxID=2846742 RepID=UPI00257D017A|nr:radical SAM protein [Candidatus Borrarchaeum sp.]
MAVKGVIIRPPVEAHSVLIGVTEGCTWNNCRFCSVYKGVQDYRVRSKEEIFNDIELWAQNYGWNGRVFLAGGNALSAPTDLLIEVIDRIKQRFPVEHISCYAKNHDLLKKTPAELKKLREAGLVTLYVGLESGSNLVLKLMNKGTTARMMIKAAKKAIEAGFRLSLYVILGLGGKEHTEIHAKETADVLNEINPPIFRFRTLNLFPCAPLYDELKSGKFQRLTPFETILELYNILKRIESHVTSEVFNDHISNYENFEGKLPEDLPGMLKLLEQRLKDPQTKKLRPKWLNHM